MKEGAKVVNSMRDVDEATMVRGAELARDNAIDPSPPEQVALEKERKKGLQWAWSWKLKDFGLTGFSRDQRIMVGVTMSAGVVQ
jgi:hypothetical protein